MASNAEAIEAVRTADALGDGLGPRAFRLYQVALSTRIAPLLRKQEALLREYVEESDSLDVQGLGITDELAIHGMETDAKVRALDAEIAAARKQIVEQLHAMILEAA